MLSTIYFIFYIYYSFFLPRMNNISRMDWIPSEWPSGLLASWKGTQEAGRGGAGGGDAAHFVWACPWETMH